MVEDIFKVEEAEVTLTKDGKVRKTHAGYSGPATGVHHEIFKKEFEEEIKLLLESN